MSFQVSSLKDPQPNIVEFYGAALLLDSSKMQLFLELMPCELITVEHLIYIHVHVGPSEKGTTSHKGHFQYP